MATSHGQPDERETASSHDSSAPFSASHEGLAPQSPSEQPSPTSPQDSRSIHACTTSKSDGNSPAEVNGSDPAKPTSHSLSRQASSPTFQSLLVHPSSSTSTVVSDAAQSSVAVSSTVEAIFSTPSSSLDHLKPLFDPQWSLGPLSTREISPPSTPTVPSISSESLATTQPAIDSSDSPAIEHRLLPASSPSKRRRISRSNQTIRIINATVRAIEAESTNNPELAHDNDLARPFTKLDIGYLVAATRSDYRQFLKVGQLTLAKRYKTQYYKSGVFIKMPSPLHERLVGACTTLANQVEAEVAKRGWKMPDGSTIETVAGGGLTPFTSNKQMHMFDPDAAITLIDAHKNKPFMLFEVATSQTAINLQRKVKDYLNGSHGWTTLIFTMNVEQDEVPDRNPIMQDFNFEVEVSRTWRPNIGPDERYTPEPVRFYQATRRFDPDQQDEPGFPGSIRVYRQDLWARRKTDPPPGDLITIEMSSFGKDAKKALKFALIDMVHSARTSIDSKQDDIDTASSEGSGPAAPPDSPVDDKKVDKTFKGGARPSNVQDGLARKTRSKGPVD